MTRRPKDRSKPVQKGCSRPFDNPIDLPGGHQVVTLKEAAGYIIKAGPRSRPGRRISGASPL